MREILFVAGEASGDTNAAGVARELNAAGSRLRLVGVGGDEMKAAGVQLIEHVETLAVMGFAGILKQIPRHWLLLNEIRARIFKFEQELLTKNGVDALFVGHPMLDRAADMPSRAAARDLLGVTADRRLLVLFPGSRAQEIERHLEPFVETARQLQERDPRLDVLVSGAPKVTIDAARCPYPVVRSSSWTLLRAADAAFCKSGTTTLEAAVAGCPFVIGYRASTLDYAIATRIVTVTNIGMVNLVAGRQVVPEFVQDELDPARIVPVLADLLDPLSPRRAEMMAALADVRSRLGTPGASKRVAKLALEMAEQATLAT